MRKYLFKPGSVKKKKNIYIYIYTHTHAYTQSNLIFCINFVFICL